jgi:hypothetical protein
MKPEGTLAIVHQKNGHEVKGELLAVHDGSLLVAMDTLEAVPRGDIRSVELLIDERRGWVAPVLILQGLPSVIIIAKADDDGKMFGVIGLGVTALTCLCFELSTPRTVFLEPMQQSDLDELSVHLRFPYGISESQLAELREVIRSSVRGRLY